MFRNYDWECPYCTGIYEHIVEFPQGSTPPSHEVFDCAECGEERVMERLISMPAEYHGERVLNPVVHGGRFDTAGQRALPPLPDVPRDSIADHCAWKETLRSKEFQEAKRERAAIQAENLAKRKRLAAIKRGENINMRRDRLPGDPKLTA